jgi:hypothetical protein
VNEAGNYNLHDPDKTDSFRYPDYYPFPYCKLSEQLCPVKRFTRQANTIRFNKQKTCQQTSGKKTEALETKADATQGFWLQI